MLLSLLSSVFSLSNLSLVLLLTLGFLFGSSSAASTSGAATPLDWLIATLTGRKVPLHRRPPIVLSTKAPILSSMRGDNAQTDARDPLASKTASGASRSVSRTQSGRSLGKKAMTPDPKPSSGPALESTTTAATAARRKSVHASPAILPSLATLSSEAEAVACAAQAAAAASGEETRTRRRVIIVAKHLPIRCLKSPQTGQWSSEWHDSRSFLSNMRSVSSNFSATTGTAEAMKEAVLSASGATTSNTNGTSAAATVDTSYDVCFVALAEDRYMAASSADRECYIAECAKQCCIPVFLSAELHDLFISGMCKTILWPLLHYVMPRGVKQHQASQSKGSLSVSSPQGTTSDVPSGAGHWRNLWSAYTEANRAIARVVSQQAVQSPTDMVFVHNYHLFVLPSQLRQLCPRLKIGMFLHTCFPTSDIFRALPARAQVLQAMMASDLIGFHTFDYARHFLSCIKRVLDLDFETMPGGMLGVKYNGRFVSILISHVGIASHVFASCRQLESTTQSIAALQAKYAGRKIVCGSADLDPIKQPLLKMQAYRRFFTKYPQHAKTTVFIELLQISQNSTGNAAMRETLMTEIRAIQAEFGQDCIQVMSSDGNMAIPELVTLYAASHVACFSTFFDGLNLQPFEFTASQGADPGALIISEFMGCVRMMQGALRVNPFSLDSVADAIEAALAMSREERLANHQRRFAYVLNHTTQSWALGFLDALDKASRLSSQLHFVTVGHGTETRMMGIPHSFVHLNEHDIVSSYAQCERRVLLLDYDGTLTDADKVNCIAAPSQGKAAPGPAAGNSRHLTHPPEPHIMRMLARLTADPRNCVFIMSGRQRSVLIDWFAELPELGLAAEKGLFLRWPRRLAESCRINLIEPPHHSDNDSSESESSDSDSDLLQGGVDAQTPRLDNLRATRRSQRLHVVDADWDFLASLDDVSWKRTALRVMEAYVEQTDGSWIEDKEYALTWHYEAADPEYGRMQANDLHKYLHKVLHNPAVDVTRYDQSRILEVKPHGVSKGHAATCILESLFRTQMGAGGLSTLGGGAGAASHAPHSALTGMVTQGHTVVHPYASMHQSLGSPMTVLQLQRATSAPAKQRSNSMSRSGVRRDAQDDEDDADLLPLVDETGFATCERSKVFVLAAGDDRSDESMFIALSANSLNNGSSTQRTTLTDAQALARAKSQPGVATHDSSASSVNASGRTTSISPSAHGSSGSGGASSRASDPHTWTVTVGCKPSAAGHYLNDAQEVVKLLETMAEAQQEGEEEQSAAADEDPDAVASNSADPIATKVSRLTHRLFSISK